MTIKVNDESLVKDIMTTPVISLTLFHTVRQVLQMTRIHNVTGFPVVDDDNKVIGIVTTFDLIKDVAVGKQHLKLGELPLVIKVEKAIIKLGQDAPVKKALLSMIKNRVGRIIITDNDNCLCGIVSRKDLINYFIDLNK